MNLADSLHGVRLLAFDTAPLIYFVERNSDYFDRRLLIMRRVDAGEVYGVCASIALTEVLVQPLKEADFTLAQRYEAVLSNSQNFRVESITQAVARRAAELRA